MTKRKESAATKIFYKKGEELYKGKRKKDRLKTGVAVKDGRKSA
jgi:hypothetical protein